MMSFASPVIMVMPNPDGAFGIEADRSHLLHLYRGVTLDNPSGGGGGNASQMPLKGAS
jgi:hypothetical protein